MEKNIIQPTTKNVSAPSADAVFDIFRQLNQVPRPSWHEDKAADFLCDFARRHHLDFERDAQNCVVIRKAATPGYESAETIVLLNHMDMVCVAEKGRTFDPLNDPIEAYIEGGNMKARGTSLGADNGIGLSMALAVLADDSLVHGPIECIATTNEEDGMTGAAQLSADFMHGRKVINLDSEDYDTITIGSAGAYLQFTTLPFTLVDAPEGFSYFSLTISGGMGGHSGVDINKGRSNANKLLAKILHRVGENMALALVSFNGGEANNAIATHAEAVVGVPTALAEIFQNLSQALLLDTMNECDYSDTDAEVGLDIREMDAPLRVVDKDQSDALIACVNALPFGVLKMSETMPETVETSNNIGMVQMREQEFFISNYSRSFVDADVKALGQRISSMFDAVGAKTEVIMEAPAWQSAVDTPFKRLTEQVFEEKLGFKPRKVAMHFALESGYYVQKFPGVEIVSIGPKIVEPHSTSERVDVLSICNIWTVLVEMLSRLAVAD